MASNTLSGQDNEINDKVSHFQKYWEVLLIWKKNLRVHVFGWLE